MRLEFVLTKNSHPLSRIVLVVKVPVESRGTLMIRKLNSCLLVEGVASGFFSMDF